MPRPAVVPLALIADRVLGEPPSWCHPVVWIGQSIAVCERPAPGGKRAALAYGAIMTAAIVAGSAVAAAVVRRLLDALPSPIGLLGEAWLLKTLLSARALVEAGRDVEACLSQGDLPAARNAAMALVSRDRSGLDERLLASAAIESLAENVVDSIAAPLFYYAVGGLPAAAAYRAVNTLDAMIGYHGRYEYLGKAAARLDDLANLLPARAATGLLLLAGALSGGDVAGGLDCLRRHRGRTESPNAGWPMSAMAGLLGVALEKPGVYGLGDPLPSPDLPAIDHAATIVEATTLVVGALATAVAWLRRSACGERGVRRSPARALPATSRH